MKTLASLVLLCLVLGCSDSSKTQAADNTARNARDKNGQTITPTDQSESEVDRGVTQKVRQALVDDSALSMNAKNIKVVTRNGKVTLRGVVASAEEKASIEAKVKAVAGVLECDNLLEIKAN